MAHPDEPQRPLTGAVTGTDTAANAAATTAVAPATAATKIVPPAKRAASPHARDIAITALVGVASFVLLFAIYLAYAAPGTWFSKASGQVWNASELKLAGGSGKLVDGALVIDPPGADDTVLVTLDTDFKSADYLGVEWDVANLPDAAEVRLLWKSNVANDRTNLAQGSVEAGGLSTFVLARNSAWIGHITGLALAVRVPQGTALAAPIRIERVVARPLGEIDVARDRLREWTTFEAFNGASINTITGGAATQDLPLPAFIVAAVALAALLLVGLHRLAPSLYGLRAACALGGLFVAAWFVVDARWAVDLARQTHVTYARYAGKSLEQKHLAAEDGELYAFVEKALALMPATPVRVFVGAGEHYFRGRAAYHLYPKNVQFEAFRDTIAPASWMKPGDWVLVYDRRGIAYDRSRQLLRWDGGTPISAELKLIEPHGAALFLIR